MTEISGVLRPSYSGTADPIQTLVHCGPESKQTPVVDCI